jgi:hypothetical protein
MDLEATLMASILASTSIYYAAEGSRDAAARALGLAGLEAVRLGPPTEQDLIPLPPLPPPEVPRTPG